MPEYIELEALAAPFDAITVECNGETFVRALDIQNFISNIKHAEVAPVRHGRWIDAYPEIEPNPMFMYGFCSECGFEQGISNKLKFCPNCGAKMDGGENHARNLVSRERP